VTARSQDQTARRVSLAPPDEREALVRKPNAFSYTTAIDSQSASASYGIVERPALSLKSRVG
jgi:hypothetical protein